MEGDAKNFEHQGELRNWGHKFLQLHKEREEIIQKKKYKK